jgi:hypothetical protein
MVALVRVEELRPLTLVTARSFPLRCHHGVRHHFSGCSLILSPPLATGTTQIGVPSADELRSETGHGLPSAAFEVRRAS